MCVSKEVSLVAFVVAIAACIRLGVRGYVNDRWIAVTLGYIATMQLLEFLMHLDQPCGDVNRAATQVAFWQNLLQPAVFIIAAIVFSGCRLPPIAWISTAVYVIFVVPSILRVKDAGECTEPCPGQSTGLRFPYTDVEGNNMVVWTLFALAMALPFLAMQKDGGLYAALILVTYAVAVGIGYVRQCDDTPATGSWWCLLGLVIPIFALGRNTPTKNA